MSRKLYQVYAPSFTAGFITSDTGLSIQESAPILKHLRGKSVLYAVDWARRNHYTLLKIDPQNAKPEQWEAASNE